MAKLLKKLWLGLCTTQIPVYLATIAVFGGLFLTLNASGDEKTSKVILIIILSNSIAQACVDFVTGDSKPLFSALARIVPAVAAVNALYPALFTTIFLIFS